MAVTIFYCWQSDRDQGICHFLIRDALKDAIRFLKSEADVEEAPPFPEVILDHDTRGVPGIPKVAEAIQKKIAACDVFIADVTHVSEYRTSDDRDKKVQNGNVLIELGQALVQKSLERILLVMNTAFGSFDGLPFDLHLHRKPILYDLAGSTDRAKVKATQKELAGKLVPALGLMLGEITKAGAESSRQFAEAEAAEVMQHVESRWAILSIA